MKLSDLYQHKQCPHQARYSCDGSQCAKFISCMVDEIDSLYVISGITHQEADDLDRELIKAVRKDNEHGC